MTFLRQSLAISFNLDRTIDMSGSCPPWCVAEHGFQTGEEDWLHVSEPLVLTAGVAAQLVMSKDPETGEQDGPYVSVGDSEYSLPEAEELGVELQRIAQAGAGTSFCRASGPGVA